jgi:hypothetical protein
MIKLLKSMAIAVCGAAVMLLSACNSVSANTNYGTDGESAYEFWKRHYDGGDLNGDGKIDGGDYLLYMKGGTAPVIAIDENGCWVIDGMPTGVSAAGRNGTDGAAGRTTNISIVTYGTAAYIWVDSNNNGKEDANELVPISNGFVLADALAEIKASEQRLMEEIAVLDAQLFTRHDLFVNFIKASDSAIKIWTTEHYKAYIKENYPDGNAVYKDYWSDGGRTFAEERAAYYALMEDNCAVIEKYLSVNP